eukprot:TRINITY_DN7243_c0_g1_i15.p1 TRINITY_DN7243_c0_g1~~TRINITY_DN7243_c0_g1_i15.p1  ORF type:complete len:246 (-),score=-33.96 TRINITY_DN7243_c0_g1_i15:1635-2372(-)
MQLNKHNTNYPLFFLLQFNTILLYQMLQHTRPNTFQVYQNQKPSQLYLLATVHQTRHKFKIQQQTQKTFSNTSKQENTSRHHSYSTYSEISFQLLCSNSLFYMPVNILAYIQSQIYFKQFVVRYRSNSLLLNMQTQNHNAITNFKNYIFGFKCILSLFINDTSSMYIFLPSYQVNGQQKNIYQAYIYPPHPYIYTSCQMNALQKIYQVQIYLNRHQCSKYQLNGHKIYRFVQVCIQNDVNYSTIP